MRTIDRFWDTSFNGNDMTCLSAAEKLGTVDWVSSGKCHNGQRADAAQAKSGREAGATHEISLPEETVCTRHSRQLAHDGPACCAIRGVRSRSKRYLSH